MSPLIRCVCVFVFIQQNTRDCRNGTQTHRSVYSATSIQCQFTHTSNTITLSKCMIAASKVRKLSHNSNIEYEAWSAIERITSNSVYSRFEWSDYCNSRRQLTTMLHQTEDNTNLFSIVVMNKDENFILSKRLPSSINYAPNRFWGSLY